MEQTASRVAFVSLGCAKNLVDSEVMIGKLGLSGWDLVADPAEADAVVINTCAFIDAAKAESTETILAHAEAKRPGQQLIVAGCLAQRYGEELRALVPEIDGIVGTGAYASIAEVLAESECPATNRGSSRRGNKSITRKTTGRMQVRLNFRASLPSICFIFVILSATSLS